MLEIEAFSKGSPIGIGNGPWRIEWSLARWRHVSGLLIRNWLLLHIVTPLSESIKLLGIIEKQQIKYKKTSVYHTVNGNALFHTSKTAKKMIKVILYIRSTLTFCKCYRPLRSLRQHDGVTTQRRSADVAWSGPELFPRTPVTSLYIYGHVHTRVRRARRQKSRQVTVPLIQWVCSTDLLCGCCW